MGKPYVRREAQLKAEVLQIVERSPLPVRQTLQELQIAPSTYYRWKSRYRDKGFNGLVDRPPEPRRVWNRLATKQRWYVVRYALEHPSLSPREVATTLVDEQVMYVSESTVYRILKEAGLIKPPETKGFPAGKEFHTKTARPNELWQTDASYFFVVGWGYYYLISVLDDRRPASAMSGAGLQAFYRRVAITPSGNWGSGNQAFTVSRGPCGTDPTTLSGRSRFTDMLLSP